MSKKWASNDKVKLLVENFKNFMEEGDFNPNLSEQAEIPYEEIQAIIDGNQYLKGKINATPDTIYDMGDRYFLMSGVSHIAERHRDKCFPGSLFLVDDDAVKEAILKIVKEMPPEAGKVLAVPSGISQLGMERLVKSSVEEIAKLEDYKMKDGTMIKIKKEGQNPGQVTDRLTVIAPVIGTAGAKPVLSLVTAFPGFMGTGEGGAGDVEIKNRADFTKNGYYFLIPEAC